MSTFEKNENIKITDRRVAEICDASPFDTLEKENELARLSHEVRLLRANARAEGFDPHANTDRREDDLPPPTIQ